MPREVHFCASLELPRRWSLCLEGLYANSVLHLSSGFALLGFPRSCTRLLWTVVFPSSSESSDQSVYGYRGHRSCSRCVLPWSGFVRFGLGRPRLSESRLNSRECVRHSFPQLYPLRPGCVPRGQWAPSTSSTASGRCSRIYPSRGVEEGLVLPELLIPSCSCRSCHKEQSPHSPVHLVTLMHWFV